MDMDESNNAGSSAGDGLPPGRVAEHIRFLKEEVKFNRNKINALEETIANLEPLRRTYSAQNPTANTTISDDTELDQRFTFLAPKDTIPKVRECNFAEFKNRFEPDGKDGCYAVDVLVSGPLLHQEIQQEHKLRDRLFEGRGNVSATQIIKSKALAKVVKMANTNNKLIKDVQSEMKWPRRIRIQSPHVLRVMARVNGERWTDRPRTYYRPFNSLIYHHPRMRKALRKLEKKLLSRSDGTESNRSYNADSELDNGETDESDVEDDDNDEVLNSPEALACLRAYVEYMDNNVMPDYHRFEKLDVDSNARVRFSDLWYLFRTGELVYQEAEGELPDRRDFRTGKRIWKTYFVDSVPERLLASATDNLEIKDVALVNDNREFSVGCYYIDYDGEGFCVVAKTVKIEQFSGEIPVNSLPVFPMRFCRDWESRLRHAVKTGESLLEFMEAKHCHYNGWTLARSPSGDSTRDSEGILLQPEHINSDVMVDFGEAFQTCPEWRPHRAKLGREQVEGLTVQEEFRIRWWSGPDRANLVGETMEQIPVRSGVTAKQRNEFVSTDPFILAVAENTKRMKPTSKHDLATKEEKALLTGRVYAYVFSERKFAQLAVAKLRIARQTGLALDKLRIPKAIKDNIQGSIQGHFLQKAAEKKIDQDSASLDLIQGKGTGLFILLHGVPGVGKTATAEAIAMANGKPLFKITAGDLGMTPEKLETSLRDIFRLASIWDCILLLDEVDTFFSERSRADTGANKNALVSVFLRVLDWYSGVLFLTTNRAGVLDEAFISRIHSKILYQNLSLEQTLDVWKLNIQRLRELDDELVKKEKKEARERLQIKDELVKKETREPLQINDDELLDFAAWLYHGTDNRGTSGRWNGRQIRNAFQVARNLAYYEHSRSGGAAGPPTLSVRHFKTMHDITESFDRYRASVRGGTEAELALEAGARHDRFQDRLTRTWQEDYQEEHHREANAAASVAAAGGPGGEDVRVSGEAYSNAAGEVAVMTATVAVTGMGHPQRPHLQQQYHHDQHHVADGDDGPVSPGDNGNNLIGLGHQLRQHQQQQQQQQQQQGQQYREPVSAGSTSGGGRQRSSSYLSAHGGRSSPPPGRDMMFADPYQQQQQQQQQQRYQRAPSPRHPGGPAELQPNYIPVRQGGGSLGYAQGGNGMGYQYGTSPRGSSTTVAGMTPRGVSPGMNVVDGGGMAQGMGGREFQQGGAHYGSVGSVGGPQTGREGAGRRHGSGGLNTGGFGAGGGRYGYPGAYGQGREQSLDTDLPPMD